MLKEAYYRLAPPYTLSPIREEYFKGATNPIFTKDTRLTKGEFDPFQEVTEDVSVILMNTANQYHNRKLYHGLFRVLFDIIHITSSYLAYYKKYDTCQNTRYMVHKNDEMSSHSSIFRRQYFK